VGAAAGSTVPDVIGTLTLPAGFMNYVGKRSRSAATRRKRRTVRPRPSRTSRCGGRGGLERCRRAGADRHQADDQHLVTAKTDQFYFCYDFKTTVAGAGATAGSILQTGGNYCNQYTSSSVATVPLCVLGQGPAAVGSLNLAGEARMDIVWLHTTGTDARRGAAGSHGQGTQLARCRRV
jgi:hypothetical protein